ncbi:hypothetical protein [Thalassospira marina]|uniref:Uncharacterized protein n=1 Tax=Thalassospira marina TaxID=2048283 RepID=A0A2N3KY28_9PROT|nr:hypothetical protein [Thalassospira marina]PKR55386.1 hypothetical protein COO20_04230 [Thalassospira marina]
MRYNELNNEGVWVSKVQSMVVDVDRLQTFNKRKKKDWLSKMVDRIDVRYIHDAMKHEVSVAKKVPLFSDDDIGVMVGIDTDELQYRYRTFHSTVTECGGTSLRAFVSNRCLLKIPRGRFGCGVFLFGV